MDLGELIGLVVFAVAWGWLLNDIWQRHEARVRAIEEARKMSVVAYLRSLGIEVYSWQEAIVNREITGEYARRIQLFDGSAYGWPY